MDTSAFAYRNDLFHSLTWPTDSFGSKSVTHRARSSANFVSARKRSSTMDSWALERRGLVTTLHRGG